MKHVLYFVVGVLLMVVIMGCAVLMAAVVNQFGPFAILIPIFCFCSYCLGRSLLWREDV